ncbi:MAG: isoaspartyl peptidase/L-asparaginase [Phaeodactylibacter sp.]|nr:isoaspartyl peptidase/L-asparaginase [Phaeodactylibacter sp.]MCB9264930.1 isoaspartyl peptidase/L-asparaginase [Lewinellaceae bacterium]MCB9291038.1 isoaspartyl peptidase/L-asparaginase [Lewinellaceae bacterium]
MPKTYSLAIHGGAGTIMRSEMAADKEEAHRQALLKALKAGEIILRAGGSALDAVEAAVCSLEDCEYFNAGKGAVFTHDGTHEMDASIMCGRRVDAGAAAMVKGVKNPISLARRILDVSEHVMLCGPGARMFAREQGLEEAGPDYFYSEYRFQQLQEARARGRAQLDHSQKYGTVGAVACDRQGHLAAATSTGGLTNKKYGRIGDSPIIGAGTYANDLTCAVSCTGYGEYFLRGVVAYDLSCLMEYRGMSLEEAAHHAIHHRQLALGGDGGLIAVDANGNIALPFNSEGMYRAWVKEGEEARVGIYKE